MRDEVENIHNYMPGMELNLKYHTPITTDVFKKCTSSFPIMN